MPRYLYAADQSLIPESIRADGDGLRPSFERILQLIDLTDDAWPTIAGLLREMITAGLEIDGTTVNAAVKLGRQRWSQLAATLHVDRPGRVALAVASSSIVYYARRGNLIKIGTTADPVGRFAELLPDEILAFEPGSYPDERFRHRQFTHLRCQGEHFQMAPELLVHVQMVRGRYGAPDPAWPTGAAAAVPTGVPASPPESTELMTARDALKQLGIPYSTLRTWVRRGVLQRAGYERGRHLYYADQLRELQPRCREGVAS